MAALAAFLLGGCGGADPPRLTFAVGGAPAEIAFWNELVEEFEAASGREVVLHRQPSDSDLRRQDLVVPLAAGRPDPDVFLMDVAWLAQFAASGWLAPLVVPEVRDRRQQPFLPRIVDFVDRWEGTLVALPVNVDAGLLYYRSDLLAAYGFSAPPATWEQLVEQAARVQEGERRRNPRFWGFVWQGAQYEGLVCTFLEFAVSHGGGIVGADGDLALATPENRRALTLMRELIHRHRVSPPSTSSSMREEEARLAFERGDALFERNWPYAWPLHQAAGSSVAGRVGIAPLPATPPARSAATLGGWHVGRSRFSDVPEAAADFVGFLSSRPTQRRLALELGWNPGRTDLYRDPEVLARLPHLDELYRVFAHAVPRPLSPYYTLLSSALQEHLNAALSGEVPPAEALAAAQEATSRVARRYAGD